MTRQECYGFIKGHEDLKQFIKANYGINYTNVPTLDLELFIEEFKAGQIHYTLPTKDRMDLFRLKVNNFIKKWFSL